MNSVVVRSAMSIGQSLLLIIQTLHVVSPIIVFTSMCFESKTRVSALVPCVQGISVVIVPYIRDNSVCTG